jgi:hypothetical protein
MTEQQKQFIEGAALAIRAHLQALNMEERGLGTYSEMFAERLRNLPTPVWRYDQEAAMFAAYLLGKLEEANGCTLETMIEAAMKAECRTAKCAMGHRDFLREFASAIALEAIGAGASRFDDHARFELPVTGWCSALILNDYDDGTPAECSLALPCQIHGGKMLIVPSIEFTYQPEGACTP